MLGPSAASATVCAGITLCAPGPGRKVAAFAALVGRHAATAPIAADARKWRRPIGICELGIEFSGLERGRRIRPARVLPYEERRHATKERAVEMPLRLPFGVGQQPRRTAVCLGSNAAAQ